MFPATSVSFTVMVLVPSPLSVTAEPLPAFQVRPPSVLYCHLVPLATSRPLTVTAPELVILSLALRPLSVVNANVGAVGATVS